MAELKVTQGISRGRSGVGVNRQEISNFPPIYFDIALLPVFIHDFTRGPGVGAADQTEPEPQHPVPVCPASVATLVSG